MVDSTPMQSSRYSLLLIALSMSAGLVAQSPPTGKIDVSKLGPQVGERVPDFNLKDQNGKLWTLQSIMGPKGAMLVFYRSADWWPYCKTQLVELQNRLPELQAKGLGLAAISYDPVETLAAFSQQRGITFPLLSDAGSATIKRYGILNTAVEAALGPNKDDAAIKAETQKYVSVVGVNPNMAGIAFPGTFILDRAGRVTSRFFEGSYFERNTASSLMIRVGDHAAPVTATKVSGTHLDLTTYPSEPAVAVGNRFSLVLDIKPAHGVHVYAPGAKGYRPIVLTIAPQPNLRVLPVRYPASEIYFFKPLKERVPVFQKPFTLVQEIVLEGTPEAQTALRGKESLTVTGTLEYQACDDKQCFNPASVPLSWTLTLRSLIRERPNLKK